MSRPTARASPHLVKQITLPDGNRQESEAGNSVGPALAGLRQRLVAQSQMTTAPAMMKKRPIAATIDRFTLVVLFLTFTSGRPELSLSIDMLSRVMDPGHPAWCLGQDDLEPVVMEGVRPISRASPLRHHPR